MANQDDKIGALWAKTSSNGAEYFSGTIEIDGTKHQIVVFKNRRKEQDKHPDWQIFKSQPREAREPRW